MNKINFATLKQSKEIVALGMFSVVMMLFATSTFYSFAETQTVVSLDEKVSLQKTTTMMSVPLDNTFPWGTVSGTIDDPAQGYPVIIQFFNEESGDEPMHVAQVDVKDDNTYEYKFRMRDVDLQSGQVTTIFEGDYTVKIFKVVNSPLDTI